VSDALQVLLDLAVKLGRSSLIVHPNLLVRVTRAGPLLRRLALLPGSFRPRYRRQRIRTRRIPRGVLRARFRVPRSRSPPRSRQSGRLIRPSARFTSSGSEWLTWSRLGSTFAPSRYRRFLWAVEGVDHGQATGTLGPARGHQDGNGRGLASVVEFRGWWIVLDALSWAFILSVFGMAMSGAWPSSPWDVIILVGLVLACVVELWALLAWRSARARRRSPNSDAS
jgi:hypothetical protein